MRLHLQHHTSRCCSSMASKDHAMHDAPQHLFSSGLGSCEVCMIERCAMPSRRLGSLWCMRAER